MFWSAQMNVKHELQHGMEEFAEADSLRAYKIEQRLILLDDREARRHRAVNEDLKWIGHQVGYVVKEIE